MNALNIKIVSVVFVLTILISSCTTNTEPEEFSSEEILKIINTQWNLISVETPSGNFNLNDYAPFMIVFWNEKIWGYDGCNEFYGFYSLTKDTLILLQGGTTLVACAVTTFPFTHLYKKPKIILRGEELVLSINDINYVYYSNFKENISDRKFLDKILTLKNSNDNNFSFFNSLGLYPQLLLTSGKEYLIRWYNKSPSATQFINEHSGVFGTNKNYGILFTRINFSYEGNGVSIADLYLVDNIVRADKYEINNNSIKIINTVKNTYYEFSLWAIELKMLRSIRVVKKLDKCSDYYLIFLKPNNKFEQNEGLNIWKAA